MKNQFVIWFKDLRNKDIARVGGKNASLGEMYSQLTKKGVNIPNGFATTAYAYRYFLKEAGIRKRIREILKDLNTHNIDNLRKRGAAVRRTILEAEFPQALRQEMIKAYRVLEKKYGKNVDVAVRSSATAEDLPDASFAGQQETFLNIRGVINLEKAVHRCIASLFTDRAISYRVDKGFDHFNIALSVGVQKMIRADKASSGVMFSIDTESGFSNAVLINSIYGLGENIVQGKVTPDEFYVFKPTLAKGHKAIISKSLGRKHLRMVYTNKGARPVKDVRVSLKDQHKFSISDKEILQLAKWAVIIENHYKKPEDMEWAKDGFDGKLYIVQARPETVQSLKDPNVLVEYKLQSKGKVLTIGASVGARIGQGKARIIKDINEIKKLKKGEVLVTEMTDPDWEPIMKIAAAIVTNSGGRTCHAAIVSRELGIPCVVGTQIGTQIIKTGQNVTVSCAEGEQGVVYEGLLPFKIARHKVGNIKRPKTRIMMNIAEPDIAFQSSFIPNDGVGLAREEFIINSFIKIHPLALINFSKLKDEKLKKKITNITVGYQNKSKFFIDKLSYGIGKLAAAFYPKDVIVRFSDFKTNEYAHLIGGKYYEPLESNPMLGWRGASRYYNEKFIKAFGLECKAIKKVREEMGLTNLKVMVPFCRTIEEGKKVLKTMENFGLKKGVNGLEVYVMVEIPSNVILAEDFARVFDGFSIGSNDLTQLTLGLDRDSELVSNIANERNEAVKRLISYVIEVAKRKKIKVGICGQGPSDFPDFATFLVEQGIDSLSLNPDTVIKTTLSVLKKEQGMKSGK